MTLLTEDNFSIKNTWFETRLQIYLDRVVQFNNTSFNLIVKFENFEDPFNSFKEIVTDEFTVAAENTLQSLLRNNQSFIKFITQQNSSTVPGIIRDIESFYGKNICRNKEDFHKLLNMKTWASYYPQDETNIWNGDYVIDQKYTGNKYALDQIDPTILNKNTWKLYSDIEEFDWKQEIPTIIGWSPPLSDTSLYKYVHSLNNIGRTIDHKVFQYGEQQWRTAVEYKESILQKNKTKKQKEFREILHTKVQGGSSINKITSKIEKKLLQLREKYCIDCIDKNTFNKAELTQNDLDIFIYLSLIKYIKSLKISFKSKNNYINKYEKLITKNIHIIIKNDLFKSIDLESFVERLNIGEFNITPIIELLQKHHSIYKLHENIYKLYDRFLLEFILNLKNLRDNYLKDKLSTDYNYDYTKAIENADNTYDKLYYNTYFDIETTSDDLVEFNFKLNILNCNTINIKNILKFYEESDISEEDITIELIDEFTKKMNINISSQLLYDCIKNHKMYSNKKFLVLIKVIRDIITLYQNIYIFIINLFMFFKINKTRTTKEIKHNISKSVKNLDITKFCKNIKSLSIKSVHNIDKFTINYNTKKDIDIYINKLKQKLKKLKINLDNLHYENLDIMLNNSNDFNFIEKYFIKFIVINKLIGHSIKLFNSYEKQMKIFKNKFDIYLENNKLKYKNKINTKLITDKYSVFTSFNNINIEDLKYFI